MSWHWSFFFLEGNNSDDASKAAFNLGTSVSWWRTLSLCGWELEEIRVETRVTHVGGPSMGTAAQTWITAALLHAFATLHCSFALSMACTCLTVDATHASLVAFLDGTQLTCRQHNVCDKRWPRSWAFTWMIKRVLQRGSKFIFVS